MRLRLYWTLTLVLLLESVVMFAKGRVPLALKFRPVRFSKLMMPEGTSREASSMKASTAY